jgi:hypothetical protein
MTPIADIALVAGRGACRSVAPRFFFLELEGKNLAVRIVDRRGLLVLVFEDQDTGGTWPWRQVTRSGGPHAGHPADRSDRQRAKVALVIGVVHDHPAAALTERGGPATIEATSTPDPQTRDDRESTGTSLLTGIFRRILGRRFRSS